MNSKELTFLGNENTLLVSDSILSTNIHSLLFDTLNAEHLVCPLLQIDSKRQFNRFLSNRIFKSYT